MDFWLGGGNTGILHIVQDDNIYLGDDNIYLRDDDIYGGDGDIYGGGGLLVFYLAGAAIWSQVDAYVFEDVGCGGEFAYYFFGRGDGFEASGVGDGEFEPDEE